ncbi:DUF4625 domain-containing protein [Leeuwenhoekiella aestuarii]|uniref:DUF4625 domain-containing protein n=1 Tax=Leeuwenhoekiella aestuarii TaxID=2249426 RepID=A0A4Q0NQV7_9FLAO|nr:DUF4625 domain-containing protein [Leeuwenhoekiella aestuarii]RXG11440.1 putative protein DUF4625 [Leeuwenhoekiella aestuarii]
MKTTKFLALLFVSLFTITACTNDDDEIILEEPTISDVEVGLNNNEIGVIGRDFHLNAELLAGDKIDLVKVSITPKIGEAYTSDWSFEITFDEFKGAKNATVHKHFDIPEDAPEGVFDFIITVTDENGTSLEETRDIKIYAPENLPVDPQLYAMYTYKNEMYIEVPSETKFTKKDTLKSQSFISGVKGDGKMYLLLINKKHNHRPESIDNIDFSKAIVYDVSEHKNEEEVFTANNHLYYEVPSLIIGATNDNDAPQPNSIEGDKSWDNGEYYFGVVYTNTTYNISVYHYTEITLTGF